MATVPANTIGIQAKWLTGNPCYYSPTYRNKNDLMLHSTATPGAPAENFFSGWNSASAKACVEFILDDVKILEFLPIGAKGVNCVKSWHCGADGNNTHIAVEVCEPIQAQLIPINFKSQSNGGSTNRSYTIQRIQMELKARGYFTAAVDGNFGPLTETAVINFQKDNRLSADGIVGVKTLAVLANRTGSYCKYDVEGATDFFNAAYNNAVHLFGFLCNYCNMSPSNIICHSEGYTKGIASNHADVMHWFPYHGKSMDSFRADVKAYMAGTYVDLGGTVSANDTAYLSAVQELVNAGVINSPDYWKGLVDATTVSTASMEALMEQSGLYFVTKSHVYGADCLADVLGLDYPDTWKGTNFSVAGTKSLITKVAKKVREDEGEAINGEFTYEDAVETCVEVGIINTPDYWLSLVYATTVKANYVQAFIRQAAAYFVKSDYQYAVSAVKNPINMNSESYWRSEDFNVPCAKALVKAVAAAL